MPLGQPVPLSPRLRWRWRGSNAARRADDDQGDDAAPRFGGQEQKDGGELTRADLCRPVQRSRVGQGAARRGSGRQPGDRLRLEPLLVATQNRYYKLGAFLLDHGADPNLANKGAWTPLYLATDNRNIEGGDYPVRKGDMDHLEFIKLLLDKGANVNARVKDSTETRTVFTNQWLDENGATAFLRASQSGDVALMKLLLAHGADPKIDDDAGRHGAAGRRRNRLGRRHHLRVVRGRDARSRQDAAGSGPRSECRRPTPAARRCIGAAHKGAPRSCRCSWTTAPSSTSAITAIPITAAVNWPFTRGSPWITPMVWFASACNRRSRIPKPAFSFAS